MAPRSHKLNSYNMKAQIIEIDAAGKTPGRIATAVVTILQGKHKPEFAPNVVSADHVRVINTDQMKFSGKKLDKNERITHSGYPGGLKRIPLKEAFARDSARLLRETVRKMLPKNKLRDPRMKHLTVVK